MSPETTQAIVPISYVGALVTVAAFSPRLLGASAYPMSKQLLVFWLTLDSLIHICRMSLLTS